MYGRDGLPVCTFEVPEDLLMEIHWILPGYGMDISAHFLAPALQTSCILYPGVPIEWGACDDGF
jgi:hypothetical protein